jgi:hypothetical protein
VSPRTRPARRTLFTSTTTAGGAPRR